jgi:5-formyltetrahydrofolate cyclo-ligase
MTSPIAQLKAECRQKARADLAAMDSTTRDAHSRSIVAAIQGWDGWRRARTVMGFLSLPEEPHLRELFEAGVRDRKRLAFPRADWATNEMDPALVRDFDREVVSARHGIREPAAACEAADLAKIDLVLVPGLAFDPQGHRLGRGGGFYDRFLARTELRATLVGICFEVQIAKEIPVETRDIPVEFLATETGLRAAPQRPAPPKSIN